ASALQGQGVAAGKRLESVLAPPVARLEVAHEAHTLEDVVADSPRLPEPVNVEQDQADSHLVGDPDIAPGEDTDQEEGEAARHYLEETQEQARGSDRRPVGSEGQ